MEKCEKWKNEFKQENVGSCSGDYGGFDGKARDLGKRGLDFRAPLFPTSRESMESGVRKALQSKDRVLTVSETTHLDQFTHWYPETIQSTERQNAPLRLESFNKMH